MAVPNTTTFDMSDVKTAVGNYDNLADLFKFADSAQFDPLYAGNKDNLLNFRNYGNQIVWRAFDASSAFLEALINATTASILLRAIIKP